MICLGFEEIEKEPKKAMALCSSAIRDAIRQYGFATTLDFVVRISNYDPIVRDLLPFFPSIASAVMLETLYERPGSKNGGGLVERTLETDVSDESYETSPELVSPDFPPDQEPAKAAVDATGS